MSDEELAKFVDDFCSGRIFTLHHIAPHSRESLAGMVFMPVALGAFSSWFKQEMEQIGTIWEYLSEAGPRSINGYPMFHSFYLVHADDWKRAVRAIEREEARRKDKADILNDLKEP